MTILRLKFDMNLQLSRHDGAFAKIIDGSGSHDDMVSSLCQGITALPRFCHDPQSDELERGIIFLGIPMEDPKQLVLLISTICYLVCRRAVLTQ